MKTKKLKFNTDFNKVAFINLTEDIKSFIEETKISDGILVVQSLHTTCSVFFEEAVRDFDGLGYDYLQHDLINGLNHIFPKQIMYDEYYKYPGPTHRKFSYNNYQAYRENPAILLNGDAHLKASLLGSSLVAIIENGKLLTGEFGDIFFVDWDTNRSRKRTCILSILTE